VSEEIAEFRPLDALEVLISHRVRFIVIGGFGAQLLGAPLITQDLDVCYSRDDENLERLAAALRELHATLRGAPADVPFKLDPKTLKAGNHFTFLTDAGALDILGSPSGARGGYEELLPTAEEVDLDAYRVKVASIDDLITMKRSADRPKDRAVLEELGALRDEIDARAAEERLQRRRKRG
jgi:hypothetical protein